MISVFRIYIGRAWAETRTETRLRSQFDAVPEFLYSATTCLRDPAQAEAEPQRRAAVRIAMTHAHVAVLLAHDHPASQPWTDEEIAVARRGFRWRVPILAVMAEAGDAARGVVIRAADRVVRADGLEIARAIHEISLAAQMERRAEIERLASRDVGTAGATTVEPIGGETGARTLPFGEIADAFHQLRTGLGQRTPT